MKPSARLALATLLFPARGLAQSPPVTAWGAPPPTQVVALSPPPPPPEGQVDPLGMVPRARHGLYISGTSFLLLNGAGVTYSYRPFRVLAFSVGGGLSVASSIFSSSVSAAGGQAMVHGLFGGASSHSFELAAGVAVLETNSTLFCDGCDTVNRLVALPSAFLGYRYHPLDGGFLFRAGAAWDFGLAIGVSVSFGAAF